MDGLPLARADVATGAYTTVTTTLVVRAWVAPEPDGSKLLVVHSSWRMITDGVRQLLLCTDRCAPIGPSGAQVTDPAWSPDGQQIAFVVNRASTDPKNFLHDGKVDWAPRYAQRELWIANGDGTNARLLGVTGIGWPQWINYHTLT